MTKDSCPNFYYYMNWVKTPWTYCMYNKWNILVRESTFEIYNDSVYKGITGPTPRRRPCPPATRTSGAGTLPGSSVSRPRNKVFANKF